jgi:hypothetical protein
VTAVTNAGVDVTVTLDATDRDLGDVTAVAPQIPEACTLAPGSRVVVVARAVRRRGLLRHLLGDARVVVPRSIRCTALLVRGYVGIGADAEGAWGVAPEPT